MKRTFRTRTALPALLLTGALLSACGSTVQVTGQDPAQASGYSLGAPDALGGPEAVLGGGLTDGPSGAAGPGSVAGSTGSVPGAPGSGAAGAAGGSGGGSANPSAGIPAGTPTGQGYTETEIVIGIATSKDGEAATNALALSGISAVDTETAARAVAAYINDRGGIVGRDIVVAPHDYQTLETLNNPAQANQEACADWTQDQEVFAVMLAGGIVEDTLLSCLDNAGTPLVAPSGGLDVPLHYADTYAKYPTFFNIAQMVGDRYDRIAIRRLAERGFFKGWDTTNGRPGGARPVVGLIVSDDSDGRTQLESMSEQFDANGITFDPGNTVFCPTELTALISCQQNAVLRMKSKNVTHMFGATLPFMNQAENQDYRPRHFIRVQPRAFADNAPAAQLAGAMAESYVPILDVHQAQYPGDPNPATARCRGIMKAAGVTGTDPSSQWQQQTICDGFFFLAAGLEKAGSVGAQQLRLGLESLGSSVQSGLTWGTFLSASEHTSATVLRDVDFNSATGAFEYVSRTNHGDG